MSELLSGKTALITGGARRVGAAISRRLHAQGANLMLHYRASVNDARGLQHELNALRPNSVALIQADLLNVATLPNLVKETLSQFGSLDILINNASSFFPTAIGDVTEKAWDDLIGTNLKAPLFLSQAAAPELRKRHGCIVSIVDIHAEYPLKNYVVYTVAKGGLLALTRSLARELGPEVRVNGVSPGAILWPESGEWQDEVARQRIVNQIVLKRVGEPGDIAKAVEFLVSAAPYVTGQILAIDGGRSIAL
jgi:pteridine reductase